MGFNLGFKGLMSVLFLLIVFFSVIGDINLREILQDYLQNTCAEYFNGLSVSKRQKRKYGVIELI